MSSTDLHQVVFKWPRTEPATVVVTGTFDKWASSIQLVKVPSGFEGVIQIPWEQKIKYKFIVDGEWRLHEDQPTEVDPGGFVNNVYTAPAKPVILPALESGSLPVQAEKPTVTKANNHRTNGDTVVAEVVDKPEYAPQSLMGTDGKTVGAELNNADPSGFPQLLSDLASTITARDGVSSALAYVASGLGAAMHSTVGIDPINIPKIAIPTPKSNDDFSLPPGMGTMSPAIVEDTNSPPSPIAPLVPIMIVPVNAAENNTAASSPPPESMHVLPRFAPEPMLKTTPFVPKAVVPISEIAPAVELEVPEEKANGRSPEPPVVNTPDIQPVVEESTERTTKSSLAPINNTLSTFEAVTQESASEQTPTPVIESVDATCLNNALAILSETAATPTTANASSVTLTVTGVPASSLPGVVTEESTADPEPIIAAVIPPIDPNLVKAPTPSSAPEAKDIQKAAAKPSAIAPESHAVDAAVVIERKIAEPIATPTVPTTPRKKTPTTSSVKDMQDSPPSQTNLPFQTTDNSPSSSRFNSVRKKRTSIFGKIKNIFHHDKEKEKK